MARWIREAYGFENMEVIPNASDNELVDTLENGWELPGWARGKQLALYTGTLGLIDDCSQILAVARITQEQNINDLEYVLIGDGKERLQLENKMRTLNLRHVHFLGLLPKKEVMRWLKTSCCGLFTVKDKPFLSTASPNKLFDAFAAGVPVVQATQGWIKELIEREQCGITVPMNDPAAMADAVVRLARGNGLRGRLGANAKRVAIEQFDRSALAQRMRGVLLRAARHGKAGSAE
jgi:glycosyltransferase involved in cell wall biosynthesis